MDILKIKKAFQLSRIINPYFIFKAGIESRYKPVKINFGGHKLFSPDRSILLGGLHEIFINEIYKFRSANESQIIIDCGANIGLSVIYFKKNYPNAQIHAFEADPKIFKYLQKNIDTFWKESNINLINKAVWKNNGTISFRSEGGASGRIEPDIEDQSTLIPCIRLKDYLDQFESIELLKMDIEGAEVEVLLDCNEILQKCNYIFVEFHSFLKKRNRLNEILLMMTNLGFGYYFKEATDNPHPFQSIKIIDEMDLQVNIFFYKQ